jgi:hypothetical protein
MEIYCAICRYCKNKYCKLWQVKVKDPENSHCETWRPAEVKTK